MKKMLPLKLVLRKALLYSVLLSGVFALFRCGGKQNDAVTEVEKTDSIVMNEIKIEKSIFGKTESGETVEKFVLTNTQGMEVSVITYGGIITSLKVPDAKGRLEDIVLGYDSLSQYLAGSPYFGAIIGRYGNRIANATFSLDGESYQLAANNGPNSLHGGVKGFDKVVWEAKEFTEGEVFGLVLSYTSQEGEEGYPGTLTTKVTYALYPDNTLEFRYEAETDKKTVVNLTQHTYFNLSGDFSQDILGHEVSINADGYLPVDETLIPEGEIATVDGTPFDFRTAKLIGQDIDAEDEQIKRGGGFDHCWVLNEQGEGMRKVADVYFPGNGRYMEVYSEEPGVQFYTGNFLDGTLPVKGGDGTYGRRTGLCLETQHYPDSPNQEQFPSVILEPGQKYQTKTSYKFSVK